MAWLQTAVKPSMRISLTKYRTFKAKQVAQANFEPSLKASSTELKARQQAGTNTSVLPIRFLFEGDRTKLRINNQPFPSYEPNTTD